MLPTTNHKYVLSLEESMMYVDAQGNKSDKEDPKYTRAHELVRGILCKIRPFTQIVTGYEPVGGKAVVYFSITLDEQVRKILKGKTMGIVARIEAKKRWQKVTRS
ncbi:MAG: hypothetical protein Q8L34_05110 [Candidatus Woesearchaeota archaeon]|nr:hypothetical protein [Candidatus Woesearchaeota archaeon]